MVVIIGMSVQAKTYYVDSESGLNMRSEPSTEAEILGKLNFGDQIEIIKDVELFGTEWRKFWWENNDGISQCVYVCTDGLSTTNPMENFTYLGNWHITAYTHTGNACANGNYPMAGYTIACNSLDFGTKVYISGIGFRVVEDRGPGWLGSSWCDVFMDSYNECIVFGSQYRDVWMAADE